MLLEKLNVDYIPSHYIYSLAKNLTNYNSGFVSLCDNREITIYSCYLYS